VTTAAEAKECATAILEGDKSKGWARKMSDYLGEWNDLMLFLEAKIREEKTT
jgi:hypothetical protein